MSTTTTGPGAERPVGLVRGTRDWLPSEAARLEAIEVSLMASFGASGYEPIATPVLEPTDLHERKSGAGIVSKLFELSGAGAGACLRPELTAGIVRAFTDAAPAPGLPWRVSHAGPVFRYESYDPPRSGPDRLREFRQVGVERIGDGGALADAEVIWLADRALAKAGIKGATIRLGHVGLILEMLGRSGLPPALGAALVERLSEAAAEGEGAHAIETALAQMSEWLRSGETAGADEGENSGGPDTDRLFRALVPVVTGRRTGPEIVGRLRQKWALSRGLVGALERVRGRVEALSALSGRPSVVLDRLGPDGEEAAPDSVAAIRGLMKALEALGVDEDRLTLDLGFGRGIGFYSQMIFEITAPVEGEKIEICGGGRYDGLARVLGSDRDDRGVGFAVGLERLAGALEAQKVTGPERPRRGWLVLAASEASAPDAARLTALLRAKGTRALLETGDGEPVSVAARLKECGAVSAVVVGGEGPGSLWLIGPEASPAPTTTEAIVRMGTGPALA